MKFFTTFSALFLVAVAFVIAADIEEEEDVLVLTDANFEEAITSHEILLVEFYAPWCGHCKSLAPEYAKAAKALKELDPPVRIAKMDATAHTKSPEKYGVTGFPTLKFFKGDVDSPKDYEGGRSSDEIQKWIIKKSGPTVKIIETADELKKVRDTNDVVVLAVIDKEDGEQRALLEKVADAEDVAVFVATTDSTLHADASAVGSIVLFKKFDEPKVQYDGEFKKAPIVEFVKSHNKPLVMTFSQEQASQIFGGDVDAHLLAFADQSMDYVKDLTEALKVPAAANKGKILHVVVPHSESRIVDFFGLKESDLPALVLVNMGDGMKKYPYTLKGEKLVGKLDGKDILAFEKKYLAGELKPTLKSAEPVDDSEDAVKVIVGKDFTERVMNSKKDVLLEFYAPWCGHCKTLAPKYDELAEKFSEVDSIVIAKMDATENEIVHPKVDVKGFPTIIFFPANDKANPVVYDGARDVDGFVEFLKTSAVKFELDGKSHGKDHDEL